MIWTFILGCLAGWFAASTEDSIKSLVEKYLPGPPLSAADLRAVALSTSLLAAAFVATLSASGGMIALTLGALCGALGPRLNAKFRSMRSPDYDT